LNGGHLDLSRGTTQGGLDDLEEEIQIEQQRASPQAPS
jgi:hypothetical protein